MATQDIEYVPAEHGIVIDGTEMGAGKQGHVFCGADVRRAVIIVNIISVVFASLGLVLMVYYTLVPYYDFRFFEIVVELVFDNANLGMGVAIALTVFRIIANGLGIYGAIKYNLWMVGISLLSYCVQFIMGLAGGYFVVSPFNLTMAALFAYPHFFFILEVRRGIMSEANYVNEKQSCCCV